MKIKNTTGTCLRKMEAKPDDQINASSQEQKEKNLSALPNEERSVGNHFQVGWSANAMHKT